MKKILVSITAVLLIAVLFTFQPVQSLAVSVLSVFRVGETKTIQITMADIEEMYNYAKEHRDGQEGDPINAGLSFAGQQEPKVKELQSMDEFTGFRFSLPKELADETPKLRMVDTQEVSTVLDTALINQQLKNAGSKTTLDEKFNGEKVTVTTPPVLLADYEKVDLIATQGPYFNSDQELNQAVWNILTAMPGIPENIRTQLADIEIEKRDVYLPVITGVGREVSMGSTNGYLYASTDVAALGNALAADLQQDGRSGKVQTAGQENTNVLIFTKDNILFVLAGSVPENELIGIGRSIQV